MDRSSHGLAQKARTAAKINNRVYRLHEDIEMESLPKTKPTTTNGKLSDSAINNTREQGLDNSNTTGTREIATRV
jgi:hypothetical protein